MLKSILCWLKAADWELKPRAVATSFAAIITDGRTVEAHLNNRVFSWVPHRGDRVAEWMSGNRYRTKQNWAALALANVVMILGSLRLYEVRVGSEGGE